MTSLKLTTIGTSTGVIIPKAMLERMNVGKGDALYVVEAPDGSYRLTPYDPDFAMNGKGRRYYAPLPQHTARIG